MTPKERVQCAVNHQQPDWVPYHISFTVPARAKMAAYYGDEGFADRIGNHLISLGEELPAAWEEVQPGFWRDEFGVVWNRTIDKDIGNVESYQIQEPRDLDRYEFPDPQDPRRCQDYAEITAAQADYYLLWSLGFSLFERAWTLRGMENLLMDMALRPTFVEELLDAILEWNLAAMEQALEYDLDACRFGDDWGQQRGMIMGPRLWRRFLKPRLAQMYGGARAAGKKVWIHSCGDIREIFPDLIEIGLDVFNPFQPEVMDIYEVKRTYGDRLAFFGGISTQRTLPHGTPDDVRREVRRAMAELGEEGGYVLAPAHDIPGDAPAENIAAMIAEVQAQGS